MTDLSDKFLSVLNLMTATNTKLDAILNALGAPQTPPQYTIEDVMPFLSAYSLKLDAIISGNTILANHLQSIDSKLASILGNTQTISVDVDDMQQNLAHMAVLADQFNSHYFSGVGTYQLLENISFATQAVRTAILATACVCDTDQNYLPVIGDVIPIEDTFRETLCARAQKFLYDVQFEILTPSVASINGGAAIGVGFVSSVFAGALSVFAGITGGAALIPGGVIAALAAALSVINAQFIDGLVDEFANPNLKTALLFAIYNSPDARSAKQAYDAAIDASSANIVYKIAWKIAGDQKFFNLMFDPNATIDASGFDGTLCGNPPLPDTIDYQAQQVNFYNGQWWDTTSTYYVVWSQPLQGEVTIDTFNHSHYSPGIFALGDFTGWTVGSPDNGFSVWEFTEPYSLNFSEWPAHIRTDLNNGEELQLSFAQYGLVVSSGAAAEIYIKRPQ